MAHCFFHLASLAESRPEARSLKSRGFASPLAA